MPICTYLISMNSSSPYLECSLPRPDCFIPPKGAISLVMPTSLNPIMPYSKASAVLHVLDKSCMQKCQQHYSTSAVHQVCFQAPTAAAQQIVPCWESVQGVRNQCPLQCPMMHYTIAQSNHVIASLCMRLVHPLTPRPPSTPQTASTPLPSCGASSQAQPLNGHMAIWKLRLLDVLSKLAAFAYNFPCPPPPPGASSPHPPERAPELELRQQQCPNC